MPRRGNRNVIVLRGAEPAMDAFKMEIAKELGLDQKIREVGWEGLTTREVGSIGGNMTKRMVLAGEKTLRDQFKHTSSDEQTHP